MPRCQLWPATQSARSHPSHWNSLRVARVYQSVMRAFVAGAGGREKRARAVLGAGVQGVADSAKKARIIVSRGAPNPREADVEDCVRLQEEYSIHLQQHPTPTRKSDTALAIVARRMAPP